MGKEKFPMPNQESSEDSTLEDLKKEDKESEVPLMPPEAYIEPKDNKDIKISEEDE